MKSSPVKPAEPLPATPPVPAPGVAPAVEEPAAEEPAAAGGFDVTIGCERAGCTASVTEHLDTFTSEEALTLLTRDLNGTGWQVSRSAPVLCPRHRPGPGISA